MPVAGLNATTCAPKIGCPSLVTLPEMLPVDAVKSPSGIQIGDPGDVIGLQRATGDRARCKRDRKHDGLGAEHPPAASLRSSVSPSAGMSQTAQMADLVAARLLSGRIGPARRPVPSTMKTTS